MGKKLMVVTALIVLSPIFLSSWLYYNNEGSNLVTAKGSKLYIGEREFTFLGANSFELWQYTLKEITEILDTAHQYGLRVIRVFLGGTAFENPLGTYNTWNLKKLDYILAYCRLKGIYVIVTLRDNNWNEDVYWQEEDGSVNKTKMYTDPETIEAYKQFITYVLGRVNAYNYRTYRKDPTILAWDICNEPDLTVKDEQLKNYVEEITGHVRSMDSRHLVTVGLQNQENIDVVSSFVDFISIHSYPDEGKIENLMAVANKPAILEEFGANKTIYTEEKQTELYGAYLNAAYTANMSGAMFWNLGLGHNPWDCWPGGDTHLFNLLEHSETWLTGTYAPSMLDYPFFFVGSTIQVLVAHSAYVTIGLLAIAVILVGILFLSRKVRKGGEIPEKFKVEFSLRGDY